MRKQLTDAQFGVMILIVMGLLLSACGQPATASARSMYGAPCHPPNPDGNVYRKPVQSILGEYYRNAFNNPNDGQNREMMQYEAMRLLASQTERWSDWVDFSIGTKNIRITFTYLSPEIIQTIILNHYLFRNNGNFTGDFDAQVLSKMETIANRNEHLFLATLIASTYENGTSYGEHIIVQLPLQSLVLTNSSNIPVDPLHDDFALEDRIDLTFASAHGYFSFPVAINVNGNCEFFLDETNNAHLVLSIPHVTINGTNYTTRPWMIDYVPPLALALDPNPVENRLDLERNPEHYRPAKEPPDTIVPVDAEYWEGLARFIWHEMTLDP